jgi:thiosulfate reductase cytochrome b subunit
MQRIYLHPLTVRIWHWVNAVACVLLFLTGIQIRYVGLIDVVSFRTAVIFHSWVGFILIANFFLWLGFYLCSPRIKSYHTDASPSAFFLGALRQAVFYGFGIFRKWPNPFRPSIYRKFNPLQLMTYQVLMLVVLPIQCITGVLLWNLVRFAPVVNLLGGVRVVDTAHVLVFIFFGFYLPAHIYLGTMGRRPSTHFKEMFTGYEEPEEGEGTDAAE